jgi:predicted nucleic acid-binding protein
VRILLDTSVYSQPLKKKPLPSVITRWKARPESDYAVSAICELEVLYGIELSTSAILRPAYERLLRDRFPVLSVDAKVAGIYARLQARLVQAGQTKPQFDLLIAATAIAHNLTLATCNVRDFADIENLRVEDWSA